jgi:putative endonuclease
VLNRLRARMAALRGRQGEQAAACFLQAQGWRVLDRNWRRGRLELDLVCEDGADLVFVEVRTRAAGAMVSPAESVTPAKRRVLLRAAGAWLAAHNAWDRACRFDVIGVTADGTFSMEHIRHAFECGPALGGSHSHRQCF